MEKRIYSLNLITYIIYKTDVTPQLYNIDGLFYAVFPECQEVSKAIKEWKESGLQVDLHRYLNIYGDIRKTFKATRGVF